MSSPASSAVAGRRPAPVAWRDAGIDRACDRGTLLVFAAAASIIAVGFRLALFAKTGFQADDAFITYRYADNILHGLGFVYNIGERVYGTTTPLLTLLLVGTGALGIVPVVAALAINLAATAVTLLVATRMLWPHVDRVWLGVGLGLLALMPSHAIWSISGMETALYIALLLAGLWAFIERRWVALGLAGGALLLTRFDGFLFVLAVIATEVLLAILPSSKPPSTERGGTRWKARIRGPLAAAVALAAVTAPWLAFAAWYFHDIVPNSVWAKLAIYNLGDFDRTAPTALTLEALRLGAFLPAYVEIPIVLAAMAVLVRRPSRWLVMPIWFFGCYAFLLLGKTHIHPWYLAPLHVVAAIALTLAVGTWRRGSARAHAAGWGVRAAAFAALALTVAVAAPATFAQATHRQQILEGAHADLGRYIRDHAASGDVVYAWDIGYIGYISGRRILDFVGIVSPEVMEANKRRDFASVLQRYRPRWAVIGLYGNAYEPIIDDAWFRDHYEAVHRNRADWLEPWALDDPRRREGYRPDYVVYRLRAPSP